jgi:hypothetical protein
VKRAAIILPFFFLLSFASSTAQADMTTKAPTVQDAGVVKSDAASKPTEPKTSEDAISVLKTVVKNFKDGEIRLGVAGILMLLIFVYRRFISGFVLDKAGKKWVPFIVAAVGFAASLVLELANPVFSWRNFLLGGLFTSGSAVLFWSTLGKLVLPKVFGEPESDKPKES